MDDLLVGLGLVLGFAFLILPLVSFALLFGTRKRLQRAEAELRAHETKLQWLYDEQIRRSKPEAAAPEVKAPEAAAPEVAAPVPVVAPRPAPEPPKPADPIPAAPAPEPPVVAARPLEQRVATWFTRIGAGALLLGALYFFKYAVDSDLIGPMGRVLVGAIAGSALLVGAEALRTRTRAAFVHALVGVGLAILFVASWAAAVLYSLVPIEASFAANVVILALGTALSWRHRAEAVMVLVLLGGFLNPVLLSTGVDRPLALFSYLFLLTSAALWVSGHHGFRVPLVLSVAGVAVLFGGWYERFFAVHDWRGEGLIDRPDAELVGAYHSLFARAVPLVFAAAFLGQWLATAFWLRARATLERWIKPLVIVGLSLAHLAFVALLHDRAAALGLAVVALAATSVLAASRLESKNILLPPLLVTFFAVAALTSEHRDQGQTALLLLLGLWASVYVAAFLRDTHGKMAALSRADAYRAALALFAFGLLACLLLLPAERHLAAAGSLLFVALAVAVIAERAALSDLLLIDAVFTLAGLGAAAAVQQSASPGPPSWDPAFLGISAGWALVIAAASAAVARRAAAQGAMALLAGSSGALGLIALAIATTSAEAPTLRALVTAAGAVLDLALSAHFARRPERAGYAAAYAAQALGLGAAAVAFGLSGATITVLWAVLVAVAAYLARRTASPIWLVAAAALALFTLARLLAFDVLETEDELDRFLFTGGRYGIYELPVFFNARAYALFGTGVAFLAGAAATARGALGRSTRAAGGLLAVGGYGCLTGLVISEVHNALVRYPPPPPFPLDDDERYAFRDAIWALEGAKEGLSNMSTTVVLALVAVLLLGAGFARRDAFHRYLGLALFVATIGKLVLFDVWNLPRLYQVVVLTVVGALLLGSGFLYARIKVLFTGAAPTALLLLVIAAGTARAEGGDTLLVPVHRYAERAALEGVDAPGDYRFTVTPELYRASKAERPLDDLRIVGADGRAIPHFVRTSAAMIPPSSQRAELYDPGEIGGGGFRATFLLPEGFEHCEVVLELSGGRNYLRRAYIEAGPNNGDFVTVGSGAVFEAEVAGAGIHSSTRVRYPRSLSRWVRVTLSPDPGAELTRVEGGRFACEPAGVVRSRQRFDLAITETRRDPENKTTILEIDAGANGAPIDELLFDVRTPELLRRADLASSSWRNAWPHGGSGVLARFAGDTGPVSLRFSPTRRRYLRVTIHDRDDTPLEIAGVAGAMDEAEVILRAASPGPLAVFVGDPQGQAAYYDLEEIHRRGEPGRSAALRTLAIGPIGANPSFGQEQPRADLPLTERHRGTIGVLLGLGLLGLAGFTIRVLKRGS